MRDVMIPPGWLTRRSLLAALGPLVAAGCTPLDAFNAVAGRDARGGLAAEGVAFGPDWRHRLDVYTPDGAAAGARLPVILFIFGGSWYYGRRQEYGFVGSALASRGYAAVIADYRLVPYGRFPDFLRDGALAIRWIRDNIARYGGDAGRLGLMGHSAGAYNAVMLALDTRYLREAGVDPRIVRAVAGLAGPYDFYPFRYQVLTAAFGDWPNPQETQPINFVRAGAPPMFLATGDQDDTVEPRNTPELASRLRARGNRVETRIYPGVGHAGILTGLSRNFRGSVLSEVTAFFASTIGAGGRVSAPAP